METETSGDQINKKVDIDKIAHEFTYYFYDKWQNNPNELFSSNIFKNHYRIKYKNIVYQGENLLNFIYSIHNDQVKFELTDIQNLDSGARRADILVVGKIHNSKQNLIYNFSQYFTIAHLKDYWFIHNSLFTI